MDIAVPSRFSCLKIEDEDFKTVTNRPKKKNEVKSTKKGNNSDGTSSNNKKSTVSNQHAPSNSQSKKKNKTKTDTKQWEEWKKKDDAIVDESYEQDLQCAIIQSKLDFEKQKKNSAVLRISNCESNKKKKPVTMSLDQFLDENKTSESDHVDEKMLDENFFDKVSQSVKKEINKETVKTKLKERGKHIDEMITLAQYQDKLEKEKAKNAALQKQLEEARNEIALVKKRNSTLCSLLSQGEMKDKAAVLVELESLTNVKKELTDEVARLYELLEQERSKSHVNGDHKNKEKKRKKN